MSLLPGQTLVNGVSNFIFGANMSTDYTTHTVRNTPQIQALIKSAGFTIMRCSIPQGSSSSLIEETASACAAMNTAMLVILHHSDLAWNTQLVTQLGSRCNLYEFSNEPDLGGITWQEYLGFWNTHIPAMRKLNPNAKFIGPVLGVFANVDNYLTPWLQGCKTSGVMPDALSYHIYPCTGSQWTASTCSARSTSFIGAAQKIQSVCNSLNLPQLPQCLTEWNIDAESPVHSFALDPNFVPGWTKSAIDSMVEAGLAMACVWDAAGNAAGGSDDLINTQTFQPDSKGQYAAMADRIAHYMSGAPTPTPVPTPTPTPTPTGVNPLVLSFTNTPSGILSTANALDIQSSGVPPTAQSYTTIGTQLGFMTVFPRGGMAVATLGTMPQPSGNGFVLDPSLFSLAGKSIPAGDWSAIVRLNAAQGLSHPQIGELEGDIYLLMTKYAIPTGKHSVITALSTFNQVIPPAFTSYPVSAKNIPLVSFADGETLYFEVIVDVSRNQNNNAQQGFRFNRLATTSVGDPLGSITTPGYQTTMIPPVVLPTVAVTVHASDFSSVATGNYSGTLGFTVNGSAISVPATITVS